jgi:hypothetical protein
MKYRGLSAGFLGVVVAILAELASLYQGPPRVISVISMLFILAYLFYSHLPKGVFLVCALTVAGVYWYLRLRDNGVKPPPVSRLETAFRDARERYNMNDPEGTIKILEPFIGARGFEKDLVGRAYHLLGLAYLSLPDPRCSDALRLLPSIDQPSLEKSLYDKCNSVSSCHQCRGEGI